MISPHPKVIRFVLLVILPFLLALVGGAIWLQGGRTASTEDAYVKADIAQVAAEVSGRVQQVLVRDHAAVEAGTPLVKLDPEPFKLVLEKAEAELDNARTTVETARAQWLETHSELAEVESPSRLPGATGSAPAGPGGDRRHLGHQAGGGSERRGGGARSRRRR